MDGLCRVTWALLSYPAPGQTPQGPVTVTLDQAIQMALQHNHNLLAARTTVQQSQAQEITANLRPNPTLFTDWEYLPLVHPTAAASSITSTTPRRATSA